eukprot:5545726-Alexandrium_andersonii.AAC.1
MSGAKGAARVLEPVPCYFQTSQPRATVPLGWQVQAAFRHYGPSPLIAKMTAGVLATLARPFRG